LLLLSADKLECIAQIQSKSAGEGSGIAFSPAGDRLVDGTWDGVLATHDLQSLARTLEAQFLDTMITSIESSPSGRLAAIVLQLKHSAAPVTGPRQSVCLAQWAPSELALHRPGGHRLELDIDGVKTTAFDNTESRLAVVRRDGRARSDCIEIIDLAEKRVAACVGCRLSPNGDSIAWSPDGTFIAAVEEDGFRFYDASQLKSIASLEFRYACHVEFSADGRFVALGAWSGGEIRLTETILRSGAARSIEMPSQLPPTK
jgi:WD40 repeat protein